MPVTKVFYVSESLGGAKFTLQLTPRTLDCYETYSGRGLFCTVFYNENGGVSFRSTFENTELLY